MNRSFYSSVRLQNMIRPTSFCVDACRGEADRQGRHTDEMDNSSPTVRHKSFTDQLCYLRAPVAVFPQRLVRPPTEMLSQKSPS
jgi:hypothetical protein